MQRRFISPSTFGRFGEPTARCRGGEQVQTGREAAVGPGARKNIDAGMESKGVLAGQLLE